VIQVDEPFGFILAEECVEIVELQLNGLDVLKVGEETLVYFAQTRVAYHQILQIFEHILVQ
jgi:hypothetical protein